MFPEVTACWIAENSIGLISSSTPSFSAMYFASSTSAPTYSVVPLLTSLNSHGAKSGDVPIVIFPAARTFPRWPFGSTFSSAFKEPSAVAAASVLSASFDSAAVVASAVVVSAAVVAAAVVSVVLELPHPVRAAMTAAVVIAKTMFFFIIDPLLFVSIFFYVSHV